MEFVTVAFFIAMCSFAAMHEQKRREAKRLQVELNHTEAHIGAKVREAKQKALFDGYKLCQGDAYVAVVKAENRGTSAVEALRELTPPAIVEQAEKRLEWITV